MKIKTSQGPELEMHGLGLPQFNHHQFAIVFYTQTFKV